jgi:putative transposase
MCHYVCVDYKELKSNNNVTYLCRYHVVFCVKYRKKFLNGQIEKDLKKIVSEVCTERECDLIEQECDGDHIHLLVGVDPQFGIHRLIRQIKGRSSRLLRNKHSILRTRIPTLWTNSYFVATVGRVTTDVVKKYVESQKERHEDV